jgi:hypothetical protein
VRSKGTNVSQDNNGPFGELPEALVEEMLSQCNRIGSNLSTSFQKLYDSKTQIRAKLDEKKILHKDTDISAMPSYPTTCAVDGAFAIERMICTDLVAFAAVAMEGLTPPSEKRYWPNPHHLSNIITVPHDDETYSFARSIMMCMELEIAASAPHDVVYIDGSLNTPLVAINQGLNKIGRIDQELENFLLSRIKKAFESYSKIVTCERTDKIFAAIPKYTTKTEISRDILGLNSYEDRGLLTFVLESGDLVGPVPVQNTNEDKNVNLKHVESMNLDQSLNQIFDGLKELQVLYYRPCSYFPVLRIEIAKAVATNPHRLAILLESLRLQCSSASILEPFPLYLADRMVKHLSTALPAIRRTTTQQMSTEWEDKMGNIYLAMHGYRTSIGI